MRTTVDLLPLARANGHKRYVRGLTRFLASYGQVYDARARSTPGYELAVFTHGRDLAYAERAKLLQFAAECLGVESNDCRPES